MISGAIIDTYGGTLRMDAPRRSASGYFEEFSWIFKFSFDSCGSSCICVVRNTQANFKS